MEVFRNMVIKDLDTLKIRKVNDPSYIKRGIESLIERKDLVIRPADKGGGLVVLSKTYYNNEMEKMLADYNTYVLLSKDPMLQFKEELHYLIARGKHIGVLSVKEASYLDPFFCRTPIIYFLPKIHKNSTHPPGRPIVNGIDSVSSRLGQYIDYFLQPMVMKTRSFVKDTKHIIHILESLPLTSSCVLITADVSSLYTIISHEDALTSVQWAFGSEDLTKRHKNYILDCLRFCLAKNYFWYNRRFFLQTRGVAMGARFAPSVANLFMAHWEEEVIYKDTPPELICYQRYIDDIIMIWDGDRSDLDSFMKKLDENNRNIVLSWNVGKDHVTYLDLDIHIKDNVLELKNHFKPTDRNAYIPLGSCHHLQWLCNIPKGQFVRIRRNCTHEQEYLAQSEVLSARFVQKGYNKSDIKKHIETVRKMDRTSLVSNRPRVKQDETGNIRIILDYNVQYKKFEKIIRKYWPILKQDKTLGPVLPERPQFVYKRAPSLRDKLAPGVIDPPRAFQNRISNILTGFYACGRCPACKQARGNVKKRKEFIATATKTYQIKDFITCSTTGVVYIMECECGLQYVGRTSRPLHVRIGEHITNIKKGLDSHNVSKHFKLCHKRNPTKLKFWGVEKVTPHWRGGNFIRQLSCRESFWVYELRVGVPTGLNVEFDLNCFISDR